jgi:uncharacterized membrane protein YfcA
VYIGARVSSRAPDAIVKPTLAAVLVLSALKLLNASDAVMLTAVGIAVCIAAALVITWRVRRVERRAVTGL